MFNEKDRKCPEEEYHYYKRVIDNDKGIAEVCKACGHRVEYPKRDGKINEKRYLHDHARDFAQAEGSTSRIFEDTYGKKHAEKTREAVKQRQKKEKKRKEAREQLEEMGITPKKRVRKVGKMDSKGKIKESKNLDG